MVCEEGRVKQNKTKQPGTYSLLHFVHINLQYSWINMVCVWLFFSFASHSNIDHFQLITIRVRLYAMWSHCAHRILYTFNWLSLALCTVEHLQHVLMTSNINNIDIWLLFFLIRLFSIRLFLFIFHFLLISTGKFIKRLKANWQNSYNDEKKNINIYWFHAIFGFQWHRVQCCSTVAAAAAAAANDEGLWLATHNEWMNLSCCNLKTKNTSQIDTHSVGRCAFNVLTGSCLISNDSLILSTNKMQLYPLNWLSVILSIFVYFFPQFFSQNERKQKCCIQTKAM